MLEEVLVVAVREVVRPRVGASALRARDARGEHAVGDVEQVAELDRLGEVVVEDVALVVDDDAGLVALAQRGDDLDLPLHLLGPAEDAEVLEHRRAELVADRPRPLALRVREQRLHPRLGVGAGGLAAAVHGPARRARTPRPRGRSGGRR